MRILSNKKVVYGFDELNNTGKQKAEKYIKARVQEENLKGKNYFFSVNDFEWFVNGNIMFYTNNINYI